MQIVWAVYSISDTILWPGGTTIDPLYIVCGTWYVCASLYLKYLHTSVNTSDKNNIHVSL